STATTPLHPPSLHDALPISVTAGGITASTTLRPAALTMKPITTKHRPVTKMEPACAPIPYCWDADKGAINAKEDPRYDGSRLRVISRNKMVPTPENNSVVLT